MFVIIPDTLDRAINAKLDEALRNMPDAERDRKHLYRQILSFFNENGYLPEFTIERAGQ